MSIQPRSPGALSSVFLIIFFLSLIVSHFFSPLAQSTQSSIFQPLTKRLLRAVLSSTAPGQGIAGDSRCLSAERPTLFSPSYFETIQAAGTGHSLEGALQHTIGFCEKTAFYHTVTWRNIGTKGVDTQNPNSC